MQTPSHRPQNTHDPPSGRSGSKRTPPSFVSDQVTNRAFLYASSTTSSGNFNDK
ncbi:hypothetical protein M407DRAFT_245876 [Tulasnella calospora MUT 4182]|uniref:Uncharacterized protein n=1 Tax=Tulasnella calospora MUT 4182 TaxID=1051891 RepID=A0A0C3PYC0_9AGAM|nr:hypothetical protein M407DRAFT_245876 [Tulasnella calospora MUT 4182]